MGGEKEVWVSNKKIAERYRLPLAEAIKPIVVASKEDLSKIEEAEKRGEERVFLKCPNWKIIPLENIIALKKKLKVIAEVKDASEAKLVLETLEKGADGVLLRAGENELKKLLAYLKCNEAIELSEATITKISRIGIGARSCVDTIDLMNANEGILVGCSSSGFLLVQAEVTENPHVATRPFRVNAGAVSQYVLTPEGKTRYLSELDAGSEVLIVARDGKTRRSVVARNKIEWRPLLLIEAKMGSRVAKAILQDAETIRVITPAGSKSIHTLKRGDKVVVRFEGKSARHFGMGVDERIIEK
ncbi:MAG: 3-dehydroquinate synthase II [Candidatus Micrarchaeia archaeon]